MPLNARLGPGDCLTVIVTLPDLQRLLQREPAARGWQVEVTAVPLPARPFLAQLLRTRDGLDAETADKQAQQVPLLLGTRLTRGEAEDLLYLLTRERVAAQVRREEADERPS